MVYILVNVCSGVDGFKTINLREKQGWVPGWPSLLWVIFFILKQVMFMYSKLLLYILKEIKSLRMGQWVTAVTSHYSGISNNSMLSRCNIIWGSPPKSNSPLSRLYFCLYYMTNDHGMNGERVRFGNGGWMNRKGFWLCRLSQFVWDHVQQRWCWSEEESVS